MRPAELPFYRTNPLYRVYEWSPAAEHALDDPEPFGFERISELMRTNRTSTAVELIRSLHSAASVFAGTPQTDDLTAVVIRKL